MDKRRQEINRIITEAIIILEQHPGRQEIIDKLYRVMVDVDEQNKHLQRLLTTHQPNNIKENENR
jgi:hypothetical protein